MTREELLNKAGAAKYGALSSLVMNIETVIDELTDALWEVDNTTDFLPDDDQRFIGSGQLQINDVKAYLGERIATGDWATIRKIAADVDEHGYTDDGEEDEEEDEETETVEATV